MSRGARGRTEARSYPCNGPHRRRRHPLVLGKCRSPRRRGALRPCSAVAFVVQPADADETPRDDEPAGAYLDRVADAKLAAALPRAPEAAAGVLVADTIVVAPDGRVLGKPRDDARPDDACAMVDPALRGDARGAHALPLGRAARAARRPRADGDDARDVPRPGSGQRGTLNTPRAGRAGTRPEATRRKGAPPLSSKASTGASKPCVVGLPVCEVARRAARASGGKRRPGACRPPRRMLRSPALPPRVTRSGWWRSPWRRGWRVVAWASGRVSRPSEDGHYYDVLARRLASGDGYTWLWPDGAVTYAAHYPVGYPALLALRVSRSGRVCRAPRWRSTPSVRAAAAAPGAPTGSWAPREGRGGGPLAAGDWSSRCTRRSWPVHLRRS